MRQLAIHSPSRCSPNMVLVLLTFMASSMASPPGPVY
jgi:hypothetical protein